ncbi:hypothetical protein [Paracoccus sp. SY]|uniref:hypothetical protein n=1 Tax=Paracoccus sp. SY TaxID=1330255 RepID=UPI000CCFE23E|nr:hypothetical protein [Paracoccus sp. SY]
MTIKQTILVPVGTGTGINEIDKLPVSVPAMPWATNGAPVIPDHRPETAPTRDVRSFATKAPPMTKADIFIAALREELAAFREARDA